jgi:hypothetical protein
MVGATERRGTARVRGPQRKNRARIKSGAFIWAPSFPQKSQQLPPSQCGAPKNKFKRVRGWDCVKHFMFRRTWGMLNTWVMVREKNFLTRIWTFQIQGQSFSNSEQCKSQLHMFLTRKRAKGSISKSLASTFGGGCILDCWLRILQFQGAWGRSIGYRKIPTGTTIRKCCEFILHKSMGDYFGELSE